MARDGKKIVSDYAKKSKARVDGMQAVRAEQDNGTLVRGMFRSVTMASRENNLRLLDEILDGGHQISERDTEAFTRWREWLRGEGAGGNLSRNQQPWLDDRARELGLDLTGPTKTATQIPRGREVKMLFGTLPKAPPGRKPQ